MPPQPATPRGLDPRALLAIRDLELRARVVVEGLWSGLHRSPFSGFSVEFTEYRQYVAGDDLRHLDWKVLARTDREYLRKFEDETNLRCHVLFDQSGSMAFGSLGYPKSEYARTVAATLGCFLLQQRDMVGVTVFSDRLAEHLPARWRHGQLRRLLLALEHARPGTRTRLDLALDDAARLFRKRSLVVLLSDLLSPVEEWAPALGRLLAGGHDARVLQILDPAELSLDFGRAGLWRDLEGGRELYLDPAQARDHYRARMGEHQQAVRRALDERGVPHQLITTDQPLDLALLEWLRRHAGRARRVRRQRGAAA